MLTLTVASPILSFTLISVSTNPIVPRNAIPGNKFPQHYFDVAKSYIYTGIKQLCFVQINNT